MKCLKLGLLGLLSLAIVAFPARAGERSIKYTCNGGKSFTAVFLQSQAKVALDTRLYLLMRQVPAASGARYKNAGYTLAIKGKEALISVGDKPLYQQCVTK